MRMSVPRFVCVCARVRALVVWCLCGGGETASRRGGMLRRVASQIRATRCNKLACVHWTHTHTHTHTQTHTHTRHTHQAADRLAAQLAVVRAEREAALQLSTNLLTSTLGHGVYILKN
jgi:hypothetical protein